MKKVAIPQIDFQLQVPTGVPGKQTAAMLEQMEEIILSVKPNVVLVYGDVTSTLAGALAAAKQKVPVAHVEAGIRTKSRMNPEEINRRVADTLSDLLFANTESAYDNLLAEGYARIKLS